MQHHREIVSIAAAALLWLGPVHAAPPEPGLEGEDARSDEGPAAPPTWLLIDARGSGGPSGLTAVLFGIAKERGRSQPASLRVDCLDRPTAVRIDTVGLQSAPSTVKVAYSLDGGAYLSGSWQAGADGSGLTLSGERAIAFLGELYGKTGLRLAVVRPLSVPFLLTFAVAGSQESLRPMAERCQWSTGPSISDAGR